MPDGDSDPQHVRTSSSLGRPRSLELTYSPSLPCLSGTHCCYTFVLSRRLTVWKSCWKTSSSPLTAPNWYLSRHCMISVWQVISHRVDARPCNDFVMLRCVRNCLCIIIIIIKTVISGLCWYPCDQYGLLIMVAELCESASSTGNSVAYFNVITCYCVIVVSDMAVK